MGPKPKTSVSAEEIPEDPQQSTAISFPKRSFGKKGDVLRSFQSDWFKNGLFYTTMNPNMLYFAIPVRLLQNGSFVFREFGSSFCKSCMLHCLNQDIHASLLFF